MTLKPWREVITPHEDVLEGSFQEASFAADLTKVVLGVAPPEYQEPEKFFERTVITEGMSLLLQSVVKRLSGKGGDPVIQLQTAFGGGKTHTLMAVLHVASGKVPAKKMLGVPELLDKAKVKELVKGRVAVLDGNALSPSHPREYGKVKANTLWGELAWQLGGEDGYEFVAASDRDGTSPGKEVLSRLFEKFGPVVVLMDETVAYLRQLEANKSYKGGTYNSNLSFLQALTEAGSLVSNAMVLASLPESAKTRTSGNRQGGVQVGDEWAERVLEALETYFGRVEALWKPVGTDEAFEIVRRRLFGPIQSDKARDEVCRAFADMYTQEAEKFPPDAHDGVYLRRLKASYPIHPEVFARLYEDWSTLPKFQRTRGVLRLMARLVHSLWRGDNRDFMILPGSIPLDDLDVRNELVKYLAAGWDPIVDKDIDGTHAQPRLMDDATPALGSMQACRRAARTIFLGSAPSVASQNVRGIGVERVRLGCAQPGQSVSKYDDALRRLSDRLHYMYSGNDRFWFDLRPNLRREMEDRMQRFDNKLHLYPEIEERLQKVVKTSLFSAVHVFGDGKDVPDKVDLRLVVLDPDQGHKRKDLTSRAVQAAEAILTKHGNKPREYQNRVLFLAPDGNATQTLRDQVRRYLAWNSIVDDADQLNLDKHHEKEAKKNRDDAVARVDASIKEAYRILLVPMQDPDADGGLSTVYWEDEALQLSGSSYDKAIETATREREWVIKAWAPPHLGALLAKWFWKPDRPSIPANKVWLDTCRYLYMPRLISSDVFTHTVKDGVAAKDWFAYAGSEKAGAFAGLLFGTSAGGIYLDEAAVLVRPDAAAAATAPQMKTSRSGTMTAVTTGEGGQTTGTTKQVKGKGSSPPVQVVFRRFHGTVEVEVPDPIGHFTEIVQNVIEHFSAQYGTDVNVTVDIEARRGDGFDGKTVRVVKENVGTLKFRTAEFEEE
jgi:predicted AAA+ superfamily ATPase